MIADLWVADPGWRIPLDNLVATVVAGHNWLPSVVRGERLDDLLALVTVRR